MGIYLSLTSVAVATLLASCLSVQQGLGFPENTPPVFDFKREWFVPENEPVGSRIITVRTKDEERDSIVYGVEPALFLDGSHYFTINPKTGDVFLKESLSGQGGNDYYLFVSANDGHQTAKIEVFVKVLNSSESMSGPSIVSMDAPYNLSYPGPPPMPRPFPNFNVPLSFPRPKGPVFIPTPARKPAAATSSTKKSVVLPKATDSTTARTSTVGHSSSVSSTAAPAGPRPSAESDAGEGRKNGSGNELRVSGDSNAGTNKSGSDSGSRRLDLVTAFLPLLAAIAFAPIVGLVFFVLHRQCSRDSKRNLMKSLSQKKPLGLSLETAETSIRSKTGELKFNGVLFGEMNGKPILSRYETNSSSSTSADNACKWEFPRHHLRFIGILGEGCFGQVWKCEALDICNSEGARIVAVKTLKENAAEKEKKDLLTELEIMKILDPHPNVVTLLGCCTERDPVFLIMDYVPYGKLQTYLRESRSEMFYGNLLGSLTSRDLTSFAYQVAKGMEYIASKGVIHRDLAARNILIGSNKTCKIADFGFARDVVANHVYERKSEGRLPIRWMALESLYDNVFTSKSDVWSFGILMWEIVTLGSTPYPGLGAAEVMKKIRDGYRLEKPEHCKREMYNIMFYCWDTDPKERPSFCELVTMLDKLLVSENDYIELDRFPDHSYYNIITNLSGERL